MLDIFATVSEENDMTKLITEVMQELDNTQVLVGVPEDKNARKDGGTVTNAALMYIHTNGSPLNNIPPRPVIEPALENDKERIGMIMSDAVRAATEGNQAGMRTKLNEAGLQGQNVAKDWFTNPANNWPPLKESTLKGKTTARKANRGDQGSENPLLDTGQLRNSLSYVVRSKHD